jgi:putative transport protein
MNFIDLLVEHPLLLLFGGGDGRVFSGRTPLAGHRVWHCCGAVCRAGLRCTRRTADPAHSELVSLGLILFVYSVGLASGPGFFASFSRSGLRDNLMVAGVLALAALIVAAEVLLLGIRPTVAAGLYTAR